MAKKKQTKKHNFKYSSPTSGIESHIGNTSVLSDTTLDSVPKYKSTKQLSSSTRDFSYVSHDLRRVTVFASALIALELILWWSFSHTALGNTVYSLIKL